VSDVTLDPLRCESIEGGEDAVLDGWLVSEGDHVRAGQVLGRATLLRQPVELHAPHDGVVEQILVGTGERFVPGHVLARVIEF
jgi:pyruvate dehydrogenase E2 component (dihydrolipoamide acetyltransferase)